MKRAFEQFSCKAGVRSQADCAIEGDDEYERSFVDILSGVNVETEGESKGFIIADALQWAMFLTETILDG